ncbi:PrsW family intramembrane metalloprotease [Nocardioides gansuensis]|uniref:PrsW family intramembrane metalloprotease n=1 Tax=Nocardioides gansuensis TaxID=2138300 RepID=A0A2T8FE66_9ACTN|nr:PrsW family glutamic-type intramembrane protease [Nocardioides gansuensis]PVG83990.1 PrsW family intramembrane metalloprotease [Nocardioides gansuensis]
MTVSTQAIHGSRRPPARWLAVLLGGTALFVLLYAVLRDTGNPIYVPSLLLLGAAVVPATFAMFFHEAFGRAQLSTGLLVIGALLGGTLATIVAGQLEFDTLRTLGGIPTLLIGLIEESAKLAVPALLLARRRVRAVDGLILGVAVGSGFAALETMGYGFVELLTTRGHLAPVADLLLVRAVSSLGGHAAWTGLACAALFAVCGATNKGRAWLRFAAVFAGVVLLHAAWDTLLTGPWHVAIGLLSFGLLLAVAWRLRPARTR